MRHRCPPYGKPVRKLLDHINVEKTILKILDLTYGRGRMWTCLPRNHLHLTGFDIQKWPWDVEPDVFYQAPAWKWNLLAGDMEYNLVAVDPPWAFGKRGREAYGREEFLKILGTPRLIMEAGVKAARHYSAFLVVHWKEQWVPHGFKLMVHETTRRTIWGVPTTSWWGILKPLID